MSGYCCLIPKSQEPPDNPLQLRPLTVLSSLYRTWARLRAKELTHNWQESWIPAGSRGGRIRQGAETVVFGVMCDLESASADRHVGGLSFDLMKAFDRVPHGLLGKILTKMDLAENIRKPYLSMLSNANRRYKINTHFDHPQRIFGGILQGDPLSMLMMNVVTCVWMRSLSAACPLSRTRSFVDDLSIIVASSQHELIREAQNVFHESECFVQSIGGALNKAKSFSFGNECLNGHIHPQIEHHDAFRLLGGSITYRPSNKSQITAFELSKLAKWTDTIKRCCHLPVTWAERSSALMRTRFQYTWGAGCHSLCATKNHEDLLIKSIGLLL